MGREVPVQRNGTAPFLVPAEAATLSGGADDLMAGGGMQAAGGGIAGGGGGGLAGNGPGGSVYSAAGLAGGATGVAGNGLHAAGPGIDGSVNGAASESGALGTGARATEWRGPQQRIRSRRRCIAPVGNVSGVTFATVNLAANAGTGGVSAAGGASTATMVTGHNRNVSLYSGSQMTVSVAPR